MRRIVAALVALLVVTAGIATSAADFPSDVPTEVPAAGAPDPAAPRVPAAVAPDPDRRIAHPRGDRPPMTIALAGDVHGELQIAQTLRAGRNPLEAMIPVFARVDVTVVNVETAVGPGGPSEEKQFAFRAYPALWSALAQSGVDVVSFANNHALDYGVELLAPMIAAARGHGLHPVGAGMNASEAYAPAIFDVGGRRIAVVGLTRVIPRVEWAATPTRAGLASAYDDAVAVAAVRAASEVADHVVVTIHWGREGADCIDEHQRRLGDRLLEAGADVIAGHHPHVLQPIVPRAQSLIAYSLGNFVWYTQGPVGRLTGVLLVTLDDRGVIGWELEPATIEPSGSPVPANPGDTAMIHERVTRPATVCVDDEDD